MSFWEDHYRIIEAARLLGCTKQNVSQRVIRGSIPSAKSPEGIPGVPKVKLEETLKMRNRDKEA